MISDFDRSLRRVGMLLGELIEMTEPLPAGCSDSALAGRSSVLELVLRIDRVMRLATPATSHGLEPGTLDALALVPLGAAALARTRLTLMTPAASHDLLASEGRNTAERAWLALHRHAVVARHYWDEARHIDLPWGERQWTLTADVTALAAAVLRLDPAIAARLTLEGRVDDAALLTGARRMGAAIALNRAWEVATSGPLEVAPLLPEQDPTSLVDVAHTDDLLDGLEHLGAQLAEHHISPAAMRQVLAHLVRAAAAASDILGRESGGKPVRQYAAAVSAAGRQIRGLASIELHDDTTVHQAKAIADLLVEEAAGERSTAGARDFTGRFPALVDAVAKSTTKQIYCGRWLIADGSVHSDTLWVQADLYQRRPECVDALEEVGRVHTGLPAPAQDVPLDLDPAWRVLASSLPIHAPAPRPAHPSDAYREPTEPSDTIDEASVDVFDERQALLVEGTGQGRRSFAAAFPVEAAARPVRPSDVLTLAVSGPGRAPSGPDLAS